MIKKEYRLITICTKPEIGKTCELIAIRDGLERKIRTSPVEDFYLSQYKEIASEILDDENASVVLFRYKRN